MDLGRLTARQQLKYLEEEARKEEERLEHHHQHQEDEEEEEERESIIGSWTAAIVPTEPQSVIQVKVTCPDNDNYNNDSISSSNNIATNNTNMGKDDTKTRLRRLGKKIRIQEDDDDDEDDDTNDSEMDMLEEEEYEPEKSSPVEDAADDKSKDGDYAKNKILGRLKKVQEQKELQKKRKAKEVSDENDTSSPKGGSSKKASITSIPKKTSSGIPRKSGDATPKEPSSLLSNIKAAPPTGISASLAPTGAIPGMPPPKKPIGSGKGSDDGKSNSSRKERDPAAPNTTIVPKKQETMPRSSPMPTLADISSGSSKTSRPQAGHPKSQAPQPPSQQRSNSTMAMRIMESLSEACTTLAEDKDSKFRLTHSSSPSGSGNASFSIDLWASLLTSKPYDYFDTDTKGKMVLQEKIPIFPEDFPVGVRPWPLSWWGIVDPALLEERQEPPPSAANGRSRDTGMSTKNAPRPSTSAKDNSNRDGPSPGAPPPSSDRNWNRHRGPPPPQGSRGGGGMDYYGSGGAPPGGDGQYQRPSRDGPNGGREGSGPPPHGDFRGAGRGGGWGGGNWQGGGGRGGPPPPFDHRGPPQGSQDHFGRGPPFPDNRGPPPGHRGGRGGPPTRQPRGSGRRDRKRSGSRD